MTGVQTCALPICAAWRGGTGRPMPQRQAPCLAQSQPCNAIVKQVDSRPIDVGVILIPGAANKVEIATYQHGVATGQNLTLKLGKEGRGTGMVGGAVVTSQN